MRETISDEMFKAFGLWDAWEKRNPGPAEVVPNRHDLIYFWIIFQPFRRSACWCWTSASSTAAVACVRARRCFAALYGLALRHLRCAGFSGRVGKLPIEYRHRLRTRTLSQRLITFFIFLVIFRYFAVPEEYQHRVLFWGILGALLMRGSFILAGIGLLQRFQWIFYGLGALLVYSGIRLAFAGEHKVDPSRNPIVKAIRRFMPGDRYLPGRSLFCAWLAGNPELYATPLLIVLAVIETTDLLFAVDSIPAVLAITLNAFIVYTSNVFAILGLRSLFFRYF